VGGVPLEGKETSMRGRVMRRLLLAAALAVLAAVWTGSATAVSPQRTVTFEVTYTFTSPFCDDALILAHEVGRRTFTDFFNPDGSLKATTIHDTAITQTLTNTETGATLTNFFSQFIDVRIKVDRRSGAITVTESINGLNFIIEGTDGPRVVSAGRGVITFLITFDANGDPVITVTETSTPNLVHLTQLLCA
jgi:hypothetical protein